MVDAAGSVAAIVAAVLILAFGWRIADPITSILISCLILVGAWRLLSAATHVTHGRGASGDRRRGAGTLCP